MTKRTIISFLLMIAGVAGLGFFAPWWAPAPLIVIIAALSKLTSKQGMFIGGISMALVWVIMASYMSQQDHVDIISKTGELLGGLSHLLMMLITLLIAFITGLLSGWLGSVLGSLFHQKTSPAKA